MSEEYEAAIASWRKVIGEAECVLSRSQTEFKHIIGLAKKSANLRAHYSSKESLGGLLRVMRLSKVDLECDLDLIELGIHSTIHGCLGIEREAARRMRIIEDLRASWLKAWYAEIANLQRWG